MDPELIRLVSSSVPDINLDLARGLATIHMKNVSWYVDKVIKSASTGFPADFVYEGYRVCTPNEEYEMSFRKKPKNSQQKSTQKNTGWRYETAQSDYFMVELYFRFKGERLPRKTIYLPFVGPGGSIVINDVQRYVTPVLADRVISVGDKNIFVRLLRDRLTFNREPYQYKADGVRENNSLVYSLIYHTSRKKASNGPKMIAKGKTSMVHYLYCKYGVTAAFQMFAGLTPIIAPKINPDEYPSSDWVIYSSAGIPPARGNNRKRREAYQPPQIEVAIARHMVTPMVKALITGLFYVADHFPHLISAHLVDLPLTWITPMGYLLFPEDMNRGTMQVNVMNHLESLDDYADPMVIENMRDIGIEITSIYSFFALICSDFDTRLLEGIDKVASMYDKEMSVLYFTLFDITAAIFNMLFGLKAAAKKELLNKELTIRDVDKVVSSCLRMTLIQELSKSHGEVIGISYSGDNMAFKATATLTPQTSTNKTRTNKGADRGMAKDPTRRLHVSVAEIGAISAMMKSDPTGRSHLNHFARLDPSRTLIVREPKFVELLDKTQEMIRRQ